MDEVYREIEIMRRVHHPNLMRVFEVIDSPLSEKLYLVMPVADFGQCMSFDPTQLCFLPNEKLRAKNVNKILKNQPKQTLMFYDEE